MPEWKRAAAWLGHIADQDAAPASGFSGQWREPFQKFHQLRMSSIAIARHPHPLPGQP